MSIDNSARIDSTAQIDEDVSIGPWSIVGPGVGIAAGTVIDSHVVIRANTRIGRNNRFFQFSSIGENPADKKFAGEETWLEIGDGNIFREGVTIDRGTGVGGGITRIASNNLMMPYVHIAHDCIVGSNTVFANYAGLSGHVEIADWVILGGQAGVNQFLKVGAHSMIGAMTHITNDVPAYIIINGSPAAVRTINSIGLERRGFDKDTIALIKTAFKILYKRKLGLQEAIEQIKILAEGADKARDALQVFLTSLESSKKGIHR